MEITPECLDWVDAQGERFSRKFFQLLEVVGEIKIVHSNFVKKLVNTQFYELRINVGNEYRVIIFAIDHSNFNECKMAICLCGFIKKSNKDYKTAINQAEKILKQHIK